MNRRSLIKILAGIGAAAVAPFAVKATVTEALNEIADQTAVKWVAVAPEHLRTPDAYAITTACEEFHFTIRDQWSELPFSMSTKTIDPLQFKEAAKKLAADIDSEILRMFQEYPPVRQHPACRCATGVVR